MKFGLLKRFVKLKNFFQQKIDRKVIIFLFFLFISTFFWLLNSLSKEYTTDISFPARYSNFPKNKVLVGNLPAKIDVKIKAYGFTLLKYMIKPALPPIKFDLRSITFHQSSNDPASPNYYILTRYEVDKIDKQLSNEVDVVGISPDTIHFQFVNVVNKKLPIFANVELDYEKQFMQNGELVISPDSIIITGPRTILDTINQISTKFKKFEKVNDTVSSKIDLIPIQNVKTRVNEVLVNIPVEKFTEAKFEIPIEIINLSDSLHMTIFPKELKLSFLVALSDYDKVREFMFKAIVDYSKIGESLNNKLKIELQKTPDFIKDLKQFPLNADFIVEK